MKVFYKKLTGIRPKRRKSSKRGLDRDLRQIGNFFIINWAEDDLWSDCLLDMIPSLEHSSTGLVWWPEEEIAVFVFILQKHQKLL
jgi:hypothetical protein